MGAEQSILRLVKLLKKGKHSDVLELLQADPLLRKKINPNASILWLWDKHKDTPLHLVARHGSKPLLMLLLDKGGDPFVRNAKGETPMHVVCTSSRHDPGTDLMQAELLEVLLTKIPAVTGEETYEIVYKDGEDSSTCKPTCEDILNLGIVDKAYNTPLHLGAASGLTSCVEMLLAHGAPLHVRNIAGQTPCDAAVQANHEFIAKLLESKMVLKHKGTVDILPSEKSKEMCIHTPEDLKALQAEVITGVSRRLQIEQSTSEALLRVSGWSDELVIKCWKDDRDTICKKAGVQRASIYVESTCITEQECQICNTSCQGEILVPCRHNICTACLKRHLELKINEGGGKMIRCPEIDCDQCVSSEIIKMLVSGEMYETYTRLNLQNFVSCYKCTKYCPSGGCDKVVVLPEELASSLKSRGPREGMNVECSNGHSFCWTCSQEPHEPCCCDLWEAWKTESLWVEKLPSDINDAAWLSCHKKCPQCNVWIEKNEGCNHMTCAKCEHEFCWVCLTSWEEHRNSAGGFYRCDRHEQQVDALKVRKESMSKLKHYYDHYNNHQRCYKVESELAKAAAEKSREMVKMKVNLDRNVATIAERMPTLHKGAGVLNSMAEPDDTDDKFLERVFRVLLKSRKILSSSYALGYYLSDNLDEETDLHETLQCALEALVEELSKMVNRPYLCTTHSQILMAAKEVDCMCEGYLQSMKEKGLSSWRPLPSANEPSHLS